MRGKKSRNLAGVLAVLILVMPLVASCGKQTQDFALTGGTSVASRTSGRYFEVYRDGEWQRLLVKGANIGASVPGHWFGELAISKDQYRQWLEEIAGMNANTIRVYTLLDPPFYAALADYNRGHNDKRLWLLQEIWPPDTIPNNNMFDKAYLDDYKKEIQLDLDALKGNADIAVRKGRAYGQFKADVSPYLLGILVGREITTDEAKGTNDANRDKTGYEGRYVQTTDGANAVEVWLAEMSDFVESRAQDEYKWQVPVAFVSWPTLDPIVHPTELTPGGQKADEVDDSQELNPAHLGAGPDAKAGFFGAYHIYPYYPDFMYREPSYANYVDEQGILRYGGYLQQFMSVHPEYPAVIAEFGLSTSLNPAHIQPEGFNHGEVSEKQQGEMLSRLMRAIVKEGYAGGVLFEWADEWAKRSWTTMPYMIPFERHIYWHNMMDPEQNFGILAMDPEHKPFSGRQKLLWRAAGGGPLSALYADSDGAFLYLKLVLAGQDGLTLKPESPGDLQLSIGISTLGPGSGTVKLPVPGLPDLPAGAEFLLQISGKDGALFLARPDYNRGTSRFMAAPAADTSFEHITFAVNRQQVSQADGTVFPAIETDDSLLNYGIFNTASKDYNSLAHWYVSGSGREVYIRLPWLLLNVSDPSSRKVIHDMRADLPPGPVGLRDKYGLDALKVENTKGFAFYVAAARGGALADYQPKSGSGFKPNARIYLWQGWDKASYRERLKQSYPEVTGLFGSIGGAPPGK